MRKWQVIKYKFKVLTEVEHKLSKIYSVHNLIGNRRKSHETLPYLNRLQSYLKKNESKDKKNEK